MTLSAATTDNQSRFTMTSSSAVVSYDLGCTATGTFPRPDMGIPILGSLLSNGGSFVCTDDSTGVTPYANNPHPVQTELPIFSLIEHQQRQATGFTFELWITPAEIPFGADSVPILSIGEEFSTPTEDATVAELAEKCIGADFYMFQSSSHNLEVRYRGDPIGNRRECKRAYVQLKPNQRQRVALTLDDHNLDWYVDKQDVYHATVPGQLVDLAQWDPNYFLRLFPGDQIFTGALHRVSIYDHAMTAEEALESYTNGLNQFQAGLAEAADAMVEDIEELQAQVNVPAIFSGEIGTFQIMVNSTDLPQGSSNTWELTVSIHNPPKHGSLITVDGRSIQVSDTVALELSSEGVYTAALLYKPDEAYFNVPFLMDHVQEENFTYNVDVTGTVFQGMPIAASLADSTQSVHVLLGSAFTNLTTGPGKVKQAQGIVTMTDVVTVTSFGKYELNPVLVTVEASSGRLTIESDLASIPQECITRTADLWRCTPKLTDLQHLRFMAYPSHLQSILDSMTFTNDANTMGANITVAVHDGLGIGCLQPEFDTVRPFEDASGVLHEVFGDHCHRSSVTVDVFGTPGAMPQYINPNQGKFEKVINRLVVCVALLVTYIVVDCFVNKCRICKAGGTNAATPAIEPEKDSDLESGDFEVPSNS